MLKAIQLFRQLRPVGALPLPNGQASLLRLLSYPMEARTMEGTNQTGQTKLIPGCMGNDTSKDCTVDDHASGTSKLWAALRGMPSRVRCNEPLRLCVSCLGAGVLAPGALQSRQPRRVAAASARLLQ